MATRPDTLSPFIAQLLAPLPVEIEQVDDKQFVKQMVRDAKEMWKCQMRYVHAATAFRQMRWIQHGIASDEGRDTTEATIASRRADKEHWGAVDNQMRMPAPDIGALRWKENLRKYDGGRPEWDAAIAADKARLGSN